MGAPFSLPLTKIRGDGASEPRRHVRSARRWRTRPCSTRRRARRTTPGCTRTPPRAEPRPHPPRDALRHGGAPGDRVEVEHGHRDSHGTLLSFAKVATSILTPAPPVQHAGRLAHDVDQFHAGEFVSATRACRDLEIEIDPT